jgi:integrase
VTTRFRTYREAYKVLTRKRSEVDAGTYDARDYQIKSKPLAFDRLAEEWLETKQAALKPKTWKVMRAGMRHVQDAWRHVNVKTIGYAEIQDFFLGYEAASKTRNNLMAYLKQFWAWLHDRYDISPPRKWPKLEPVEMAFRNTVDIPTQEAIINDIKEHEMFRVWLAIKWLATYIAIRPGEMRSLTEGQVDRARGVIIIPHPKEKRAKIIPLIEEDLTIVRDLPLAFDAAMPFFRSEKTGSQIGICLLYEAWKRSCRRLGIEGVDLYGGTKHSTAMGLRAIYTPEQIMAQTLHSTGAAFRRYFQTGGEDLRQLLEGRKSLVASDNGLTMTKQAPTSKQPLKFIK